MREWYSLHIFYYETAWFDDLLTGLSEHLKESEQIEDWFFIRYWSGGPHIRLRLLLNNPSSKCMVHNEIYDYCSSFWKQHPTKTAIDKEKYYSFYKQDEDYRNEMPLMESQTIEEISYIPELERYGGEAVMDIQEAVFHASSLLAIELIKKADNKYQLKYLISAAAIGYLASKLVKMSERFFVMNAYAYEYWESVGVRKDERIIQNLWKCEEKIEEIIAFMESDKAMQDAFGKILSGMEKTGAVLQNEDRMLSIISSQLHMLNNRLGISPYLEYHTLKFWEERRKKEDGRAVEQVLL